MAVSATFELMQEAEMDEHVVMSVITRRYCGRTHCAECDHAGVLWTNTLCRV